MTQTFVDDEQADARKNGFGQTSLREKAVKGVLWSGIQKWGREAISFVILVILTRMLAPEAFGLVALATVFTAIVEIFLDQGFGAAIVQRADLEREHLDTAFWISMSTAVFLTALTIAASGHVAAAFQEPRLAPVLSVLSISFLFGGLSSTQMALLQRRLAFKSLAARSMTATVAGGIAGVSLAFAGFGVWSLVVQKLSASVTAVLVLWRTSDWRPGVRFSTRHFQELFSFGVSVTGNNALKEIVRRSDDLLIGYFLGPTLLGYYNIGYRLLLVVSRLVTGLINAVAFPTFSRLRSDPKQMLRAFYKVTQYTSLFAFPVFVGLGCLAPELIPALFGEKWAPSVPVMQVLALMGILQSVLAFHGSVLRASGKPSWQFGLTLVNAVCCVIAFSLAVQWGIVAVAVAFVAVGYLLAPISYVAVRTLLPVDHRTYLGQFLPPLAASLLMLAVIMGLKYVMHGRALAPYLQLSLFLTAGVLTYLLAVCCMAPSLSRQVLELVGLAVPRWKLTKM